MKFWMSLLTVLIVGGLAIVNGGAQDVEEDVEQAYSCDFGKLDGIKIGIYHDFTLARQIRLGAAYYFDPELVRRANVAYMFSVDDFIKTKTTEGLYQHLVYGEIAFANLDKATGNYVVISPVGTWLAERKVDPTDVFKFKASLKDAKDIKIVAMNEELCGITSKKSVVSWDPREWAPPESWKVKSHQPPEN